MKRFSLVVLLLCVSFHFGIYSSRAATLDLGTAKLSVNDQNIASLAFADGEAWTPGNAKPAFLADVGGRTLPAQSIEVAGNRWTVHFAGNATAEFNVMCGQGFALFRLIRLTPSDSVTRLQLFALPTPNGAKIESLLNGVVAKGRFAAVMAAEPNVHAAIAWVAGTPGHPLGCHNLCVETLAKHGVEPAAFGVLACNEADALQVIERFEKAAGLPSPQLGGVWNKTSPWVKQSYFFVTSFRESQVDETLALARRGHFSTILLGQESWTLGTGHYTINPKCYRDGLDGLKRTMQRFKDAGFRVGLHVLAASIYPPDPYITPVPDKRLVTGATTTLAADIDDKTTAISAASSLDKFPAKDGGYMGKGMVLRIGDELIAYGEHTTASPYEFTKCHRGHLGTKRTAHHKGETVFHLVRSYGYHMYDMDTSLMEEVARNFAAVADACGIDMVYFDGSEDLQGDHWYYNARMHKVFYDALKNKNILFQASSTSHYSWHILARGASADGHGDLKGYLDERSPAFWPAARCFQPLDIGWYYGYDPNSTLDQYEYILGATIGYNSSMSFQVSCDAAARHPFTGDILDLIARYEKLRLSGRVPEDMRAKLRIDPVLATKPERQAKLLDHRREYRLLGPEGHEYFQRVVYEPWQDIEPADANAAWKVNIADAKAHVGVQIHVKTGPKLTKNTVVDPFLEIDGHRWQWHGTLHAGQYVFFWPGESPTCYGLPLKEPKRLAEKTPDVTLPAGEHTVRFGCAGTLTTPIRVRVTLQPPERFDIPAEKP